MKRKDLLIFFLLFLVLFSTYSPALFSRYAHLDDYYFWGWERRELKNYPQYLYLMLEGRYLGAFILAGYGKFVANVADLNLLRINNFLYIWFASFIFYLLIREYFNHRFRSFLFAVMVFTLPPFQIMVSWSVMILNSTSMFLAILAALLARTWAENSGKRSLRDHCRLALSVIIMIAAVSVYQTAAMFYWVVVALVALSLLEKHETHLKRMMIRLYAVGFVAISLYFIMTVWLKDCFPEFQHFNDAPLTLSSDIFGKLKWFIEKPLVSVLNFWIIPGEHSVAMSVLAFIAGSVLAYLFRYRLDQSRKFRPGVWFKIICLVSFILLSFLPNFAATLNSGKYRCYIALAPIILLVFLLAFNYYVSFVKGAWRTHLLTMGLFILSLMGIVNASNNILHGRVLPSQQELELAMNALKAVDLSKYSGIAVVRPSDDFGKLFIPNDEFYISTAMVETNMIYFLRCAFNELGLETHFVRNSASVLRCRLPIRGTRGFYDHYFKIFSIQENEVLPAEGQTLIVDLAGLSKKVSLWNY